MERTLMKTRTIKRVMIEHSTFRQMLSYKPYVSFQADKQKLKNELKQDIINFYSDKFYRLKEGSRDAIDFILFSGCTLGFSYVSQEYLSKFGVSERTIRRIMSELQSAGLISIAYRRNGCLNMCKKPVYFLTKHPYFYFWKSLIGIDDQYSNLLDSQEESDRIVDKSIESDDNQVYNYELTFSQNKELEKDRSENEQIPIDNDLDYLPSYIDRTFGTIYKAHFGMDIKRINQLWTILKQQAYKVNIEPENVSQAGIWSLKQLISQMKIKKIKNIYAYYTQIVKDKCHEIFNQECESEYGADFSKVSFSLPYD
jgi:hypothetical protein